MKTRCFLMLNRCIYMGVLMGGFLPPEMSLDVAEMDMRICKYIYIYISACMYICIYVHICVTDFPNNFLKTIYLVL